MREGVEELTGEEGWCWQRLLSACRPDFSPLYARFAAFPADFAADFLRQCGNHQGGGVHIALHPAADRQKSDRRRNKESKTVKTRKGLEERKKENFAVQDNIWCMDRKKIFWDGKHLVSWKRRSRTEKKDKHMLEKEYFTSAGGAMDNNLK